MYNEIYFSHARLFIDRNENFVKKRFEIIAQNSVHNKTLKRRDRDVVACIDRHF